MRQKRLMWIVGIGIALLLSACDRGQIFHRLGPNSVVLAFGDDLTSGTVADQGLSYPKQLEKLIGRRVVDAGAAGETSADGAMRLPKALADHEPDLVILGIGGGDLESEPGRRQLRNDLRHMFEAVNQQGIPVVMIVPAAAGKDANPYRELAVELEIPLIRAPEAELPSHKQDTGDPTRPEATSHRQLAKAVADKLYELRSI